MVVTGDSYCAAFCTNDTTCPNQKACVGSTGDLGPSCKHTGTHTTGNGVCGLYNGGYGPNTCLPVFCNVDADCQTGEGCMVVTNGDNYCTSLCTSDPDCPSQKACTGSTGDLGPSCKHTGTHTTGNGICGLYNGGYGPNTCGG